MREAASARLGTAAVFDLANRALSAPLTPALSRREREKAAASPSVIALLLAALSERNSAYAKGRHAAASQSRTGPSNAGPTSRSTRA